MNASYFKIVLMDIVLAFYKIQMIGIRHFVTTSRYVAE